MRESELGAAQATPASVVRATALVLFSACCFGSIATLVTLATNAGTRLTDILAWRFLLAAMLLVAVSGGFGALRTGGVRCHCSRSRVAARRRSGCWGSRPSGTSPPRR